MQLGSAHALKQQLDGKLRQRNTLMEKFAYCVSGLGDIFTQEMFRPPLAKGIVRLGPRDYGLAIRVYAHFFVLVASPSTRSRACRTPTSPPDL